MKLLIFAHRKEAEAFIDHLQFKPHPHLFDGLFKNNQDLLLVTGEGLINSSERTISVLSNYHSEISSILNIGIAGSLTPTIKKNDIVTIRTSYCYGKDRPEFKSYTSSSNSSLIDCISISERALTLESKTKLIPFAHLLDRELWSIGSAAVLHKKPFQSIKYISDELNDQEFCQLVISESELLSKKLLSYYLESENDNARLTTTFDVKSSAIYQHPSLYFTVTQERQLDHYLSLLKNLNFNEQNFLSKLSVAEIINLEILPKEKTKKILDLLLLEINPIHQTISKSLDLEIAKLKKIGIVAHYDRMIESNDLTITAKFKNNYEKDLLVRALASYDMDPFESIFHGHLKFEQE